MTNLILIFVILLIFLWLLRLIEGWFKGGEPQIAYVQTIITPKKPSLIGPVILLICLFVLGSCLIGAFPESFDLSSPTAGEISPTAQFLRTTCPSGTVCPIGEFYFTIQQYTEIALVAIPEGTSGWWADCRFVDSPEAYTTGVPGDQNRWMVQPPEQRVKIFQICEELNLTGIQ